MFPGKFLLVAILSILIHKDAFSQSGKADFNIVLSHLETVHRNRPVENIYIHFDKPYYAAGDTIYFKTYVTINELHKPTPLSEVVHVDLITPDNGIVRSIRLKLKQGTAYADFELPDSLPAGVYRIRAYTRWMLNEGKSGSFFNQLIPIGSIRPSRPSDISTGQFRLYKPDVRFFPEGGELLTGVESKVAFKSIGSDGLGIKVKGIVVDNDGKEITRFQSVHLGMGFFYLKPEEGKSYRAQVTFGDGSDVAVNLPKANPNGMVVSAENESPDTAFISVWATRDYLKEHSNENITLLIYSGGIPSIARAKLDRENITFAIGKQRLHSGIMRITLFSAQSEPTSERLLFIMNHDQLDLQVKSEKSIYNKREKVEISVKAQGPVKSIAQGDFSVSVINEDIIKSDENKESTIFSNLLLTTEINGYVEQPNYYFKNLGDDVSENLDILMLTQGYRHFLWKQILADSLTALQFKAEKDIQLEGLVRSRTGEPVKNDKITLSDPTGRGPELKDITDAAGQFIFKNLEFSDTVQFTITALKNDSRVFLRREFSPMINTKNTAEFSPDVDSIRMAYLNIKTIGQEYRAANAVRLLKEDTVTGEKPDDSQYRGTVSFAGYADQVFYGNELRGGGSLTDQLAGQLRGVIFSRGAAFLAMNSLGDGTHRPTPMTIVLDGVETRGVNLNDLNPTEIKTIEVLKSGNTSMYGFSGSGGVLVITTKKPEEVEVYNSSDRGAIRVYVMGFYKAREFYSPKYEAANTLTMGQDLRTTVFWKPDIITDKDGNATFNFYNADLKGTYRVVVEGIDENGNLGRQVYRYKVQ
jgi:hypothetical protein